MKKIHLSLFFSLAVLTASAQHVYFVYVQSESEQPFFVKINGKINSSTASGYVILSKLIDSTYQFSIGFPQNKWPEQNFSVTMSKKDHGYLLKNFGEKGWGLYDLQTMVIQMAIAGKASIEVPHELNKDISPFTEILSKAADDPSLKEKPLTLKAEEKKTEVAAVEIKKEEPKTEIKETVITKPEDPAAVAAVKKEEVKPEIKETVAVTKPVETIEQPVVKKEEPKETTVAKKEDQPVEKKDETKQVIAAATQTELKEQPLEKKEEPKTEIKEPVVVKVELKEQPVEKKEETKTEPVVKTEEVKAEEPYKTSQVKKWAESNTTEGLGLVFIDEDNKGYKDTIRVVIPNPKPAIAAIKEEPKEEKKFIEVAETPKKEEAITTTVKEEKTIVKNNCRLTATENDFLRLRKKMAGAPSDDGMVGEAKRFFRSMCFSTAQIKNLSVLLITDEGKYKFFDAAYNSVYDLESFASLNGEIRDQYYAGRFKAMLRN